MGGWWSSAGSFAADEVAVDGVDIIVGGGDAVDADAVECDLVEQAVEAIGIAGFDQDALAIGQELGFDDAVLGEDQGGQAAGFVAADQDLAGLLVDFAADVLDLSFGDDVAVAEEDDVIGDHVDFMQDMAGDDDVAALGRHFAEHGDGFGADEGIEAVEGFIEDEDFGIVGDGLRELDALPHSLAVAADFAVGGFAQADLVDGFACQVFALGGGVSEEAEVGDDELEAGESLGIGIELRGVAEDAEEFLGFIGPNAQDANFAARGADQAGHEVHEGGFAGAVGSDEAGDSGGESERDAVDAEHFAVEAGDIVEGDVVGAHLTTSNARIFLESIQRQRAETAARTIQHQATAG